MELFNIPVSYLRQFLFCPRIPYFVLMKGLNVKKTPWVKQGLTFHDKSAMLTKRRNLTHYGLSSSDFRFLSNINLNDEELGLHGICDGAIYTKTNEIFPLEFKITEGRPPALGAKLQLTAYAMLLERKENTTISRGFILMGKRGITFEIQFDEEMRLRVLRVAESIRITLDMALIPVTAATSAQCCQCEYSNFCADRL